MAQDVPRIPIVKEKDGAPISIHAKHAWLSLRYKWAGTEFGSASFWNARLSDVGFSNATFRYADFLNAVFGGRSDFFGANFQSAYFGDVIFEGKPYFNGAVFNKSANFSKATFNNGANFDNAVFNASAGFANASFADSVYFRHVAFNRAANFTDVKFQGVANFFNSAFRENAHFTNASFENLVRFSGVAFEKACLFRFATWPDLPDDYVQCFLDAQFQRLADFSGADFGAFAAFDGAIFYSEVRLNDDVVYNNAAIGKIIKNVRSPKIAEASAARALAVKEEELRREAERKRRSQQDSSGLSISPDDDGRAAESATFQFGAEDDPASEVASRFFNMPPIAYRGPDNRDGGMSRAQKKEFIRNYLVEYRKRIPLHYRALENGARSLKHALENARDKLGEQRLYRLELLARRRQDKTGRFEHVLSRMYQITSDFGASMWRPLITVIVVTLIMAQIYAGWWGLFSHETPVESVSFEALDFSARAVFRPFSHWAVSELGSSTFESELLFGNGAFNKFMVRLVTTLQSFFSVIMLFLTALSARRHFQLH
ncbi:pentapeptide repeat-containing protein [Hyphococcus sp.]|uniref:pentapeptide repeat-containing protein n=1 Tax=Hyphococcus sp. TaxID=2038636 RepID=UPI0035C78985